MFKIGDRVYYNGKIPKEHTSDFDRQLINDYLEKYKRYEVDDIYFNEINWLSFKEPHLDNWWYPAECFELCKDIYFMKSKYNLR